MEVKAFEDQAATQMQQYRALSESHNDLFGSGTLVDLQSKLMTVRKEFNALQKLKQAEELKPVDARDEDEKVLLQLIDLPALVLNLMTEGKIAHATQVICTYHVKLRPLTTVPHAPKLMKLIDKEVIGVLQ